MDSVDEYARQWAKREQENVDSLSEWETCVRSLIQIRIKKNSIGQWRLVQYQSLKTKMLLKHLSHLHNKCVVAADKASNKIVLCVNHIT
jgi:hypothetical protein